MEDKQEQAQKKALQGLREQQELETKAEAATAGTSETHGLQNPADDAAKVLELARLHCPDLAVRAVGRGGKMVLEPSPKLFMTAAEEKNDAEEKQVEQLRATVDAKKAWLRVSEEKKVKAQLQSAISTIQSRSKVLESDTLLLQSLQSQVRLKDSDIDVAVHEAQLKEVMMQRIKLRHHEAKIMYLQAKINAVEHMKRESSLPESQRTRFFCDCFQGLSTWFCRCLLERGWRPYPSEAWFVTEKTKLQIYAPLAKSQVDYSDSASFSRTHSILWEGGEWLEEKVRLAMVLRRTQGIMPPTFLIDKDGSWGSLICAPWLTGADGSNGSNGGQLTQTTNEADDAGAGHIDGPIMQGVAARTLQGETMEELASRRWFLKDSTRNFGTGVQVCENLDKCQQKIRALLPLEDQFVAQPAVEPQMLHKGKKFMLRIYLLAVSRAGSVAVQFFCYTDAWLACAKDVWVPGSLDWDRNVTRERDDAGSHWAPFTRVFPVCLQQLAVVVALVMPKLVVKVDPPAFELFGCDFVMDSDEHPWLMEVNRSPRMMDKEGMDNRPMLHALLDLVFREQRTPDKYKELQHPNTWIPVNPLRVPPTAGEPPMLTRASSNVSPGTTSSSSVPARGSDPSGGPTSAQSTVGLTVAPTDKPTSIHATHEPMETLRPPPPSEAAPTIARPTAQSEVPPPNS